MPKIERAEVQVEVPIDHVIVDGEEVLALLCGWGGRQSHIVQSVLL